jgi:transposase
MVYLVKKKIKGNIYLYLEESARINGKSKRIWSQYLGPEKDVKNISTLSLNIADLEIVNYEFGFPVALMQIADKLDLIGIINRATDKRNQGMSVGQYLAINVLNRCIKPLSKRQLLDWFNTTYLAHIFPQIDTYLNSMAYSNHYEYLTDTAIERIENDLISVLASEFQVDMSHLIYDPTNFYTYMQEQEDEDELDYAQFGHGKEHRDNLRIVGLVLICTEDGGIPIFSEIYPGNIPDVTLFKSQAVKIKKHAEQFRIGEEIQLLLNFDKGNNSSEAFTTLDSSPILFIASIRPSMVKDLASIPAQNFPRFTLPNGKEVGVL